MGDCYLVDVGMVVVYMEMGFWNFNNVLYVKYFWSFE